MNFLDTCNDVIPQYSIRLRDMRQRVGLSQEKFAEKFGIPIRTYQQWERGVRKPAGYVVDMIEIILQFEGVR